MYLSIIWSNAISVHSLIKPSFKLMNKDNGSTLFFLVFPFVINSGLYFQTSKA
jgi:hypothetical protein